MTKITELLTGRMSGSFKKYPIEISLGFVFFILYMIASSEKDRLYWVLEIFPHAIALSFVLNGLFPQGRARIAYYASFLFPSVFFFVSPSEMFGSEGYICSVFIAALAVLSSGWARENDRFTVAAMDRISAGVSAGVVSLAVYLAAISIYASLIYIFNLHDLGDSFYGDAAAFCGFVLVPWTFFSFLPADGESAGMLSGILRIVVGYVLSPALVIYTAIMYVYFVKIALVWELPKGNVAYMVSAFMVAGAAGGMCGSVMENRHFGWFYKWFGLISLPLLAMFWVGSLYRVGQYGMTEARIYLLALGFLATLYAVRFIFPAGRYVRIALMSIAVLSALTFVPGISARDMGLASQTKRLEKIASQIGVTDENGRLVKAHTDSDTLHKDDYRELFGTYAYVAGKKGWDYMKENYGFENAYDMSKAVIPEAVRQYALYGPDDYDTVSAHISDIIVEQESGSPLVISGYVELNNLWWYSVEGSIPEMERGWTYHIVNDSLTVRRPGGEHLVKIDMNSYVRSRMPVNADGSKVRYSGELSRESKNALIYCDTAGVRIVFDRIEVSVDSTGTYGVDNVVPLYVLTK